LERRYTPETVDRSLSCKRDNIDTSYGLWEESVNGNFFPTSSVVYENHDICANGDALMIKGHAEIVVCRALIEAHCDLLGLS
jgi:hypothetical protein